MRSDFMKKGVERIPHRALFYALGLTDEEIERPIIGVVNAQNEIIPGHMHLDSIAEAVKAGIRMAGGTPIEFPAIGVCDGIAMNHEGMFYSLPSREHIADSVEIMAMAHPFDGLVFIPNCDKIVPGMLMAALRLNIPSIFCSGSVEEAEQPVLTSTTDEEDVVTVTDEETGALTPEGNLTLVDDYHTDYSDGSGQQFITLVSKSGATFYLVIDRNAKGQQTVHFMNLVDEADLLSLMEEEEANAYTAEKEAAAQAEQDRLKAEEEAKKAAEEAAASGTEQPKENKVTKIASGFLGVVVLIALAAGGGFYFYHQQMQKKKAEKEALDPDANYTEDKGDFEIPTDVPDEDETPDEQDTEPI